MIANERDLFGDEQAYIAWKRQQEREAKAEAFRAAEARKKRRRVKYSDRIIRALRVVDYRQRMQAIRADPDRYEAHKKYFREYNHSWRQQNPERSRAIDRRNYLNHRQQRLFEAAIYRDEHREEIRANHRRYRQEHIEQDRARSQTYRQKHRSELNAKGRQYHEAHREERASYGKRHRLAHLEEIQARERAYRLAHREEIVAKSRARRAAQRQDPQHKEKQAIKWKTLIANETPEKREARMRQQRIKQARYQARKKAAQQEQQHEDSPQS